MANAPKARHVATTGDLTRSIPLRRVHATVPLPLQRIKRDRRELIFHTIQRGRDQSHRFVERLGWLRYCQSLQEKGESPSFIQAQIMLFESYVVKDIGTQHFAIVFMVAADTFLAHLHRMAFPGAVATRTEWAVARTRRCVREAF